MPTLKIIIHNDQFVDMKNLLAKNSENSDKDGIADISYKEMVDHIINVPDEEFIETYLTQMKYLFINYVEDNKYGEVENPNKKIDSSVNGANVFEIKTDNPDDVIDFFHIDEIFDENFMGMRPHIETFYNKINEKDIENLSQREIQKLIDNALDDKDFETVKALSPYIKEGKHIMYFESYIKSKL